MTSHIKCIETTGLNILNISDFDSIIRPSFDRPFLFQSLSFEAYTFRLRKIISSTIFSTIRFSSFSLCRSRSVAFQGKSLQFSYAALSFHRTKVLHLNDSLLRTWRIILSDKQQNILKIESPSNRTEKKKKIERDKQSFK